MFYLFLHKPGFPIKRHILYRTEQVTDLCITIVLQKALIGVCKSAILEFCVLYISLLFIYIYKCPVLTVLLHNNNNNNMYVNILLNFYCVLLLYFKNSTEVQNYSFESNT